MSIVDAILLGLLQGLTEFIPVSSSGHLILLDEVTDVSSSFSFDVIINIGTLLALVLVFKSKLADLFNQIFGSKDRKLLFNVIVSTVPAVIVGGLWADFFADEEVRNINIVVIMLLIGGVLMVASDKFLKGREKYNSLKPTTNALWIGLGQALALIPGTSRSGATILSGRAVGLSNQQAAEYSFLRAIPIIAGAVIRSLFDETTIDLIIDNTGSVFVGIVVAFLSGMFAIKFMLSYLSNKGLSIFGLYRIILAFSLLLFVI